MAPALALPVVDTDQGEDAGASRRTPRPSRPSGGTGDTLIGPSSQILPASRAPCAGHAGSMGSGGAINCFRASPSRLARRRMERYRPLMTIKG